MINYPLKYLEINPVKTLKRWKKKNTVSLPLYFFRGKPYVELALPQIGSPEIMGNFLIDTGLSDALWIFSNDIEFKKKLQYSMIFWKQGSIETFMGREEKFPN